jgi:P-type Cu2+ transporter
MSGRGVEASVNGTRVAVGGPRLLRERDLDVPDQLARETEPWRRRGASVNTVAAELGIDEVFAEVLPEDKERHVRELQERGHRVAIVGDGVNDAPALARADVGIAIGAGTDVAIESAGVILASDDPRGVVSVVQLSRASYRKMLQNLGWAAGYNVLAIPLAAGVLAPWGITMPPAVGALLMSISTIVVALNAQLLHGLDLRPASQMA